MNPILRKCYILLAVVVAGAGDVCADERGAAISTILKGEGVELTYHALIIGINDYDAEKGWNPLAYPESDTNRLNKLLAESYGFQNITYLQGQQATQKKILSTLSRLENELTNTDSLFIFYAGHGHTILDGKDKGGYWVPSDGSAEPASWISLERLHQLMESSSARHILLMSDSCYAGSFFSRGVLDKALTPSDARFYRRQIVKPSRYIITSGDMETVPDKSSFAENLINILEDVNYPYVFSAENIYHQLKKPVFRDTGTQVLAKEMYSKGAGGNFIFVQRNSIRQESMLVLQVSPPEAVLKVSHTTDHVKAIVLDDQDQRVAEHRVRVEPERVLDVAISLDGYHDSNFSWQGIPLQRRLKRISLREWRPQNFELYGRPIKSSYLLKPLADGAINELPENILGWSSSDVTATAISDSKEYSAVAKYTRETFAGARTRHRRVYSASVFIKKDGQKAKELKCYPAVPKGKEERSSRKIRDMLFLPRNERYLVVLSGDHLFLWDTVEGNLIRRKLLPRGLGITEQANLKFIEIGKEFFLRIAAEKTLLPDFKLLLK